MEEENRFDTILENLMVEYLEICNRAMRENSDKLWYRLAKRLNRTVWSESNFHAIVYDQNPDIILGEFIIHFDPDDRKLSLIQPGGQKVAFSWKIPLGYLQDVAETRPDWYVAHPVMLDWKWFTKRICTKSLNLVQTPHLLKAGAAGFLLGTATGALSVYLSSRTNGD